MDASERAGDERAHDALPLRLDPRRVTIVLLLFLLILLIIDLLVAFGHLKLERQWTAVSMLFDMDREGNVPTLFNVLLFLFASLLFHYRSRWEKGPARWPWSLMAFILLFLGVDEGSQIHERFMLFTLRILGDGDLRAGGRGWLFYAWYIPYGVASLALIALLVPWFLRLSSNARHGFLLAGATYVSGAVFVEAWSGGLAEQLMLSDADRSPPGVPCEIYQQGSCFLYGDTRFVLACALEETLEMLGVILCIRTLLGSLRSHDARILIGFASGNRTAQ